MNVPDLARLYELDLADGREAAQRLLALASEVHARDPAAARFYRRLAAQIAEVMDEAERWLAEHGLAGPDNREEQG